MRLRVGLLRFQPGWHTLLQQIGTPWSTLTDSDRLTTENFSVIIVNDSLTSSQEKEVGEFLHTGGSVLGMMGHTQSLHKGKSVRKYYATLNPSQFPGFPSSEIFDVYMKGVQEFSDSAGRSSELVSTFSVGRGTLITLPFDVDGLVRDTRAKRKNFYFAKDRLPSEIVSVVSKGVLRRLVLHILETLHHRRGLPFVHQWHIPNGAETMFTFRVDSDKGTQEDVQKLFDVCKEFNVPTAWFLDTKSHEKWLEKFASFGEQEVGIHCYHHETLDTVTENAANFSRAARLLHESGIEPIGAAAPFGRWNEAVGQAYEQLNLPLSSEFSYAYDALPSFPWIGDSESPVVQIPIHPICIGSMMRSGYSSEEMLSYFVQVIERKLFEREPICFYHHPTHHHTDVIRGIFQYLKERGIEHLSYSQYAAWWKKRNAQKTQMTYDAVAKKLTADRTPDPTVQWRVSFPDGSETITSLKNVTSLGELTKLTRTGSLALPPDLGRIRSFDWRHILLALLDEWYRRTQ